MARAETAILDGLEVGYGPRDSHNSEDATVHAYGRTVEVELRIDQSTIADLATGVTPSSKVYTIPVGAKIVRSDLTILEAFDALTSVIVGTKQASDGAAIDADGLHTIELLAVLLAGATFEGNGVLINADVTTVESVVSLDVTGSAATVGEAVLRVEYLEPVPSSSPPSPVIGEI